jgi:hypothetical protein
MEIVPFYNAWLDASLTVDFHMEKFEILLLDLG